MYLFSILTFSIAIAGTVAAPFKFPTPDGFPNLSPAQLARVEKAAGGPLPNGPLPTSLKSGAVTALQLLANNELFEVAFFTELLNNVTSNARGYDIKSSHPELNRDFVIKALSTIVEQEKIHALGANAILVSAKQAPIAPCEYQFPVSEFKDAILLAQTFTDLAIGTLPEVQTLFATDGGDEVANVVLLGSILGQESQQDGFYRTLQQKTPSAAPFITGGSAGFAFTALQMFIVPGSCPKPLSSIGLPTFKPLTLINKPQGKNTTITFSVTGPVDCEKQSIVYLSGQNLPLTVPCHTKVGSNGTTLVTVAFPFDAGFSNGLTIAALVNGKGNFTTPDAVAADTVYGPGLIEVD
ncbi:MAG: hypothetical protein Q9191_002736 [Dirinaria sp. TL-2023a]